jgi:hypothetical protein
MELGGCKTNNTHSLQERPQCKLHFRLDPNHSCDWQEWSVYAVVTDGGMKIFQNNHQRSVHSHLPIHIAKTPHHTLDKSCLVALGAARRKSAVIEVISSRYYAVVKNKFSIS